MTTCVPFSWMWGDPAEVVGRLRVMRAAMEKEEKRLKEQARRRKARRIRKLVRLAKAGELKGRQ